MLFLFFPLPQSGPALGLSLAVGKEKCIFFSLVYLYLFLHFLTDDLIGTGHTWVLGGTADRRESGKKVGQIFIQWVVACGSLVRQVVKASNSGWAWLMFL